MTQCIPTTQLILAAQQRATIIITQIWPNLYLNQAPRWTSRKLSILKDVSYSQYLCKQRLCTDTQTHMGAKSESEG